MDELRLDKPAVGCAPLDHPLELPEIQQAQLDWDALSCVLADLDDLTDIHEIRVRRPDGQTDVVTDLVEAHDALRDGEIIGLQITYQFADQSWCDTLLRDETGAALMRMADPMRAEELS